MKYLKLLTLVTASLFINCGGGKNNEEKEEGGVSDAISVISNASKAAKEINKAVDKAEKIRQERVERGDTLSMHYEKLAEYLPQSISGYELDGELKGNTVKMPGMSYSTVEQRYKNEDGNELKVSLADYNSSPNQFHAMLAMYNSGIEIDNTEKYMKGFELDNGINGWEEYNKKSKRVNVISGVGYRFYISVEAENQEDTEFAKDVLAGLQLDELSKL